MVDTGQGLFVQYNGMIHVPLFLISTLYRPISRDVIGREVDYNRSRLIYVRYCLTNTTLCL